MFNFIVICTFLQLPLLLFLSSVRNMPFSYLLANAKIEQSFRAIVKVVKLTAECQTNRNITTLLPCQQQSYLHNYLFSLDSCPRKKNLHKLSTSLPSTIFRQIMIIRQLYGGHSQKKELQFLLLIFTKSNKTRKKCNELVSLYQVKW